MREPEALGEVIASTSQALEVECHTLYAAPAFGSFVRADCVGSELSHFAVVTHVATAPYDSNRVVQAHRLPPGELEERKPHLTTLFRTTFQARVVGYGRNGTAIPGTAPQPARLHCFTYRAAPEQIQAVTRTPDFLRALTQVPEAPLEDLLVSAIESAREAWGAGAPVVSWGKYLARLLRGNYVALEHVMERLGPSATLPGTPLTVSPAPVHPRWEEARPLIAGNGPLGDRDPFQED
jgi:hypothetical protein